MYVELRSAYGADWLEVLGRNTIRRAEAELAFVHMSSTDANLVITHLDVSSLLDLIRDEWQLFERSLIDRHAWEGRVRELRQVRHRMAHCRRPHSDDLSRIEQMLLDLEKGALRALSSYNAYRDPHPKLDDPMVAYWVRGEHPEVSLMEHAEQSYDIAVRIAYTQRPWANPLAQGGSVTGTPGYLWHVIFYLRRRGLLPSRLWRDSYLDLTGARSHLVSVSHSGPSHVSFAFPATDPAKSIANDVGACLHAVLSGSQPFGGTGDYERFEARMKGDVDPRVQIDTPWTIVDESTTPITIFSA